MTDSSLNWVTGSFGWLYLVVSLGILVFLVFLAFSLFGDVRLGKDSDRPEFATVTWLAMILSAVMGIGLVSYGVAEPISHLAAPPHGLADPNTPAAARPCAAVILLRLGTARLGDLRGVRPGDRLLHLPQGPADAGEPTVHPAAR